MAYQYVNDISGKPLYVLVPIADFEQLTQKNKWQDIPTASDEFDDVLIPHEVVDIMFDKNISQIAAWRVYRGFSQEEAARRAGISQSALSQIEKIGSRPHEKTREKFAAIYQCLPEQLAG